MKFFKSEPSTGGKTIALLNQKGGVGKTTIAFNLAFSLANLGHRILCIDMDPQGNLSFLFGERENRYCIYNLLINTVRELKKLHEPINVPDILQKSAGVELLPGGQELSGFELTVATISAPRQLILKKFIEKNQLRELYDFIIIDSPPTLGLLVVNILCAADGVLVPFQSDNFSRQGLKYFHGVLENIAEMNMIPAPPVIGYIPNLIEGRRYHLQSEFKAIRQELKGGKIFNAFYNKRQLAKSIAEKKSVFHFNSKEFRDLKTNFTRIARYTEKFFQS